MSATDARKDCQNSNINPLWCPLLWGELRLEVPVENIFLGVGMVAICYRAAPIELVILEAEGMHKLHRESWEGQDFRDPSFYDETRETTFSKTCAQKNCSLLTGTTLTGDLVAGCEPKESCTRSSDEESASAIAPMATSSTRCGISASDSSCCPYLESTQDGATSGNRNRLTPKNFQSLHFCVPLTLSVSAKEVSACW